MKYILALDLGGTKTAVGIVNFKGQVLYQHIEPTDSQVAPQEYLIKIKKLLYQALGAVGSKIASEVVGIGIAGPGPLNYKKGMIIFSPNMPRIKNFSLVKPLKKEFSLPAHLENDANAAALAEWKFGAGRPSGRASPRAGRGTKNMIYFTVSTGIGSGIIINNQIYRGQGNAGELGHTIINPGGPKCGCGNFGCWEAISSGRSISREAKKVGLKSFDAKSVFQAAARGNLKARRIVNSALEGLAIGLLNAIHIFNPDKIILGGGVMNDKKYILPFLRKSVKSKVMPGFDVKIEAAKLGKNLGLVAAATPMIMKFIK